MSTKGKRTNYHQFIDHAGEVYGRWIVLRYSHTDHGTQWVCRCSCPDKTERVVRIDALLSGKSQSCGCLAMEVARAQKTRLTHGMSKSKDKSYAYGIWKSMRRRCRDPKDTSYPYYGGRGISVCEEWENSYEAFFRDMGPRPSNCHSIDRIDSNRNYEPGNCRWSTAKEQRNNQRPGRLRMLTLDGETRSMKEWSEVTGIGYSALRNRVNACGWSDEKALTTPIGEAELPENTTSYRKFIDHTGETHNDWTILSYSHFTEHCGRAWLCRCKCGTEKPVPYSQLKSGKSKRCATCSGKIRMAARIANGTNPVYRKGRPRNAQAA